MPLLDALVDQKRAAWQPMVPNLLAEVGQLTTVSLWVRMIDTGPIAAERDDLLTEVNQTSPASGLFWPAGHVASNSLAQPAANRVFETLDESAILRPSRTASQDPTSIDKLWDDAWWLSRERPGLELLDEFSSLSEAGGLESA